MVLPTNPNAISSALIRNEFTGITTPNPTTYGSLDSNLYQISYYRSKYYYNGTTYVTFPATTISFHDFHGTAGNCPAVCDCVCSNCGDGCFVAGTLVMMADGSLKKIEEIKVGERVLTLTGVGTVLKTPVYMLGVGRQIVKLSVSGKNYPGLFMSDDHSLWTKHSDGQEWWGTYNYSHYLWEMSNVDNNDGEGPQLEKHSVPLVRQREHYHATIDGFEKARADYSWRFPPDTSLFHLIVDKGSYICDGFVVSSSPKDWQFEGVTWEGIKHEPPRNGRND